MKKQIIIPIVTALAGLLAGFLIFNRASEETPTQQAEKNVQIWTCSMHPQIRKTEPGDCPICGMDLIPLEDNGNESPLLFEMSQDAIRIANIQTTVVGNGSGAEGGLTLSGRLVSDETAASSLVSHIPGRIERLYVSFTGDHVSVGQRIAKIYSPRLISAQGELLEAYKIKDTHPELLEAAKNKLRYWKISEKEIDGIIQSQQVKEYFDIYAEHSGVISKRKVNVGDHLMEGGLLFDVQNLNSLWAVFDVYEQDLSLVNIGDEITFTTPAISGKEFASKVVFIDPVINPSTRTASVRLEVPNSHKTLKPDMFITGKLFSKNEERSSQLFVPKSAVLWTGERSVVYVKQQGTDIPTFEYREVELGESNGNKYAVNKGLKSGEEVVTNGAFVIDASAQLNNRSSMMNRNLLGVEESDQSVRTPDYKAQTSEQFKQQLQKVVSAYLALKDDLVTSESVKAKASGKKLEIALQKVDMKLLKGEAHMYWMDKSVKISEAVKQIISGKNVDVQRGSFDELSVALISAGKAFGIHNEQLYIQYCPMANGKKGAYWLSTQTAIRNPYFGDQMLKCGEVKDSIVVK